MLLAIDRERGPRPKRPAAVTAATVEASVKMVRAVVLLDLIMPNGKSLRACSGGECAGFEGWFKRITAKVGPKQIVGEVLDEAAVQKIYATAAAMKGQHQRSIAAGDVAAS
jgi:hypothetical protein